MCVSEAECFDELFVSDAQDYEYSPRFKPRGLEEGSPTGGSPRKRERSRFKLDDISVTDKEMDGTEDRNDRSVDVLSDGSDSPSSPRRQEGFKEEEASQIFHAFMEVVSGPPTEKSGGYMNRARTFFGL